MNAYPCGNHWKKYDRAPVYERLDGLRIHLFGLVRLPNGTTVNVEYRKLWTYQKIKGGSRKRGMMALATKNYPEKTT